jgi:phosphotriesterase-related protein
MELLGAVVMGAPNRDNWLLIDEKLAIEEVGEFKKYGGSTLVDLTNIGLKRDPRALRRVSEATGLHIVMGSSWYGKGWYGDGMDDRSVESLAEEIVRDITIGVGNTGIRSGIIGEVRTGKSPLTPNEQKVIRASGRASRMTGAAVTFSSEAILEKKLEILDLLVAEGTDLSRVIIGQSNLIALDMPFMKKLLDRGLYLQFDMLGRQPSVRTIVGDTDVAAAIDDLIAAGYIDRILLSQGVDTKVQLKAYGGTGYSFISRYYVPYLRRIGVTDAQIHTIMVENPGRVLALVPPHAGTFSDSEQ